MNLVTEICRTKMKLNTVGISTLHHKHMYAHMFVVYYNQVYSIYHNYLYFNVYSFLCLNSFNFYNILLITMSTTMNILSFEKMFFSQIIYTLPKFIWLSLSYL